MDRWPKMPEESAEEMQGIGNGYKKDVLPPGKGKWVSWFSSGINAPS
jgi:hypothetical protein